MSELFKVRRALFCCFLVLGFVMASWIVRTPSIRDSLSASTGQMGMVLFGFSIGSMTGILQASNLVRKFGAGGSISLGLVISLFGLLGVALGTVTASPWLAGLGLGLVALGMASSEVAVNILGAHIERDLASPVLTHIHGCFSLGTAIGASCGLYIVAREVSVAWHMLIVFCLLIPLAIYVMKGVWGQSGHDPAAEKNKAGFFQTIRNDPRLLLVGLIVLAVALAEGAANDWLPLLIVDTHQVPEKYGSMIFVAFAVTMTIGRFVGTGLLKHYGPVNVMRVSGVVGALGVLTIILAPNLYVAAIAVVLWGTGASLGFPVAMSAGAAGGSDTTARISVLAIIGYSAFLVGPPLLGFIGEHIGLRWTMLVVLALLFLPIILASALRSSDHAFSPK